MVSKNVLTTGSTDMFSSKMQVMLLVAALCASIVFALFLENVVAGLLMSLLLVFFWLLFEAATEAICNSIEKGYRATEA